MTLTLELTAELEARLAQEAATAGVPLQTYILGVLSQRRPDGDRHAELAAGLQAWIEAGAKEAPDDELLQQLDADRLSDRPLYPTELKGVTW